MLRALAYVVSLVVLVGLAVWLADHPGNVSLEWQGWRIDTSMAVLAFAVALIAAVTAVLYRIWLFVRRAPGRMTGARREGRRRRGYLALTRGMVAVAAGDTVEARRQMRRADGLLGDPALTMLLSAQALQLAGDEQAAEKFFHAMLARPETEFLGLRGLITQALKRDDTTQARELAGRAFRLQPGSDWVAAQLFDLEVRAGAWKAAHDTLDRAAKSGLVTAAERTTRATALDFQMAMERLDGGDGRAALKLLRRVHDAAPGFAPAAIRLARIELDGGHQGRAASLIERAWTAAPHPDLADAYWRARGADDALARVKAAQRLARSHPDHRESHLIIAEAALEAHLWGEARHHLARAAGDAPSARVCRRMAELEEAERDDLAAARGWLLRATLADPDPAWVCGDCGHAQADWTARCGHCGAFARFAWQTPSHVTRLLGAADSPLALGSAAAGVDEGGVADDDAERSPSASQNVDAPDAAR